VGMAQASRGATEMRRGGEDATLGVTVLQCREEEGQWGRCEPAIGDRDEEGRPA
jgi:hypothetical protein